MRPIQINSLYQTLRFINREHGPETPVLGKNGMVPVQDAMRKTRELAKSLGIELTKDKGEFAESCYTPVLWRPDDRKQAFRKFKR